MYPVSEAFLQAVQEDTRNYYWTGRITTKAGTVHEFSYEDIVKGSGYVTAQCCGSSEIELGTVYAAEMGISLYSQVDRYTLDGAEIELSYHLRLADGTYEEVPMGIFEVAEANRTVNCLEIKAYDRMLRFDRNWGGFGSAGTAYELIAFCCRSCKVELANTEEEIGALPNGSEMVSIYPENDIETFRDVLHYVGQVLGGFFIINRKGKLELRRYGTEAVMEIGSRHRFTSSFSDFITRYTAISSTNMRTQTAEYYALETDDGLTMNLGVNPLLQFGLKETRERLCRNILSDIASVEYVPFDSDTIGNPALDLGDVLSFTGGQADAGHIACITSFNCRIGGRQSLKCVGKNPRLAGAKSKNDKNISGLLSQITETGRAGMIGIRTFTNASAYSVHEEDVRIISIEFAMDKGSHAEFHGQVVVDVDADRIERNAVAKGSIVIPFPSADADTEPESIAVDAELPVTWTEDGMASAYVAYELNDEFIETHHPAEAWHSGKHTLSLYYPIEGAVPDINNTFRAYLRMEGGTGTIDAGGCIASISGQGMAALDAWDGRIEIEERWPLAKVGGGLRPHIFNEESGIRQLEEVKGQYTETMAGRARIGAFGRPFSTGRSDQHYEAKRKDGHGAYG